MLSKKSYSAYKGQGTNIMLSKRSYSAYKGQWRKLWKARTNVPLNEGGCPACKVVPLALVGYHIPLYVEYCHALCPIDYSYLKKASINPYKTCKNSNSRFNTWRESGRGVEEAISILNNTKWLSYEQYCGKVQKYFSEGVTLL